MTQSTEGIFRPSAQTINNQTEAEALFYKNELCPANLNKSIPKGLENETDAVYFMPQLLIERCQDVVPFNGAPPAGYCFDGS